MNKLELKVAKKIARIEGKEALICRFNDGKYKISTLHDDKGYNPFDWSILGPLMVKYGIMRAQTYFFTLNDNGIRETRMFYLDDSEIPMAILKCIIKSQEK